MPKTRHLHPVALAHPGPCPSLSVLAQLLCLLVWHVDVVEATEEGSQDDHEDEHEPGREEDKEGSEQVSSLERSQTLGKGIWEGEAGLLALCLFYVLPSNFSFQE